MSNRIVSLLIIASAVGAAACSDSSTAPTAASAILASASGSSTGGANVPRTIIETMLTPQAGSAFQRASGKAKWQSRDASRRELEIEIEDVSPGTRVSFFLGGAQFGATQTVDALGNARIELSTQLGDQVPATVSGQSVEVRTEAGAVVVAGSFR